MKKQFAFALALLAMTLPAQASTIALRGVATGPHPYALVEIDGSVYILSTGDTIAGKRIRSISTSGVRLSDGTVLHVTSSPSAQPAQTVRSNSSGWPQQPVYVNVNITPAPQTFDSYSSGTYLEAPAPSLYGYPAYGYGSAYPYNGYGAYPHNGYGAYPYNGYGAYPHNGYGYGPYQDANGNWHRRRTLSPSAHPYGANNTGAPGSARSGAGLAPVTVPSVSAPFPPGGVAPYGASGAQGMGRY